ncbi:MAG: GatB/YqeY domain-containing protein [Caldilineaceae bacterium]|nr:GatB/YqeY domain-containing protein [Caldilineaceae bacterium]
MADTSLIARLDADLKQAMREKDETTKLALRSLKGAITEAEKVDASLKLTEADLEQILQKAAKQRRDAIAEYQKANRPDLAAQESAELAVLERYLPRQLTEAEIETIVRAVIAETGATSVQDMSKVMPVAMQRTRGQADGRAVNQVVRRLLSS